MRAGKYCLNTPTIAMVIKDGHPIAHTIPAGAALTVEPGTIFEGHQLVEVTWGGKRVLMFAQDLRARCVPEHDA